MTAEDRARAWAGLSVVGRSVTIGGVRATITSGPRMYGGTSVELTLRVDRDGEDVTPEHLNPVIVTNPPLGIMDGDRLREDPEAALMQTVARLVK